MRTYWILTLLRTSILSVYYSTLVISRKFFDDSEVILTVEISDSMHGLDVRIYDGCISNNVGVTNCDSFHCDALLETFLS